MAKGPAAMRVRQKVLHCVRYDHLTNFTTSYKRKMHKSLKLTILGECWRAKLWKGREGKGLHGKTQGEYKEQIPSQLPKTSRRDRGKMGKCSWQFHNVYMGAGGIIVRVIIDRE